MHYGYHLGTTLLGDPILSFCCMTQAASGPEKAAHHIRMSM